MSSRLHIYCYVGPLECIFIALLALENEEVRVHFFRLMEVPMHEGTSTLAFRYGVIF